MDIAPPFLTLALDGCEWSASRPGSGERTHGTHYVGGWVGPIAGLDAVEWRKISWPCWESNPGHPSRLSPNPQAGGHPRLFIYYICSHPSYVESLPW
jgi:hypothetical protein